MPVRIIKTIQAYNQFGLNMTLNQYFGLGKFGERIGW